MIPLYQKITLLKKSQVSDGWGGFIDAEPIEMRCRITEGTRSLKNVSTEEDVRNVRNREIVTYAKIWLPGLVAVTQDDMFEYTDELDQKRKYVPIMIDVVRGVSGEPLFTVVSVGNK